jgi:hypothetical protein
MRHITLIVAVVALAFAAPAFSEKGGNGNGNGNGSGGGNVTPPSGSCTVEGNVVTGTGLPNWELMNFMVTDSSGTWGWVLGQTDNGAWSVTVPARSGATTYEFASRTWGPSGSKYEVYASCSA